LLNDAQTFSEPGNTMENASKAMIRLWKVMQESHTILKEMKLSGQADRDRLPIPGCRMASAGFTGRAKESGRSCPPDACRRATANQKSPCRTFSPPHGPLQLLYGEERGFDTTKNSISYVYHSGSVSMLFQFAETNLHAGMEGARVCECGGHGDDALLDEDMVLPFPVGSCHHQA
jgi:hypothetical protein